MLVYLFIFFLILFPTAFLIMIGHLVYSMIFSGENILTAVFSSKNLDSKNWVLEDSTFVALLGKINLKLNEKDLDKIRTSKIKLEVTAILGKVEISLPEEASFMAENKGFCGSIKTEKEGSERGLYYENNYNYEIENEYPGFLFNTKSIFGVININ